MVDPMEQAIRQALDALEIAAAPGGRAGFAARAASLDALEAHVEARLGALAEAGPLGPGLRALLARAKSLRRRLAGANGRVLRGLRKRILAGRSTPEALRRAVQRCAGPSRDDGGYDALDALAAQLLLTDAPAEPRLPLEPGLVAYQPTPARAILALIERARLGPRDRFYDLGSGLGQVAALVALLSGARATGIEREPAYCDYARRCAAGLRLQGVDFVQADVRHADLGGGTVYYLYTPFRGAILAQVLQRLRQEAAQRPLRVCSYGPCTLELAEAGWRPLPDGAPLGPDTVAVFQAPA
jgi:hypothetical protein